MASLLVGAAAAVVHAETASFSAAHWDLGNQRWRDTATTPYEAGQLGSYDYASATVQFEHPESGPALAGVLTGSGLKPNFTLPGQAQRQAQLLLGRRGGRRRQRAARLRGPLVAEPGGEVDGQRRGRLEQR